MEKIEIDNIISQFQQKFLDADENPYSTVRRVSEEILNKIPRYLAPEIINVEDLIYLNVYKNWTTIHAIIFIISSKLHIKLAINHEGLVYRTEHIIQRDIKKVLSTDNSVNIYFHGLHDGHVIEVDNYDAALKLQRRLTELRDRKNFTNNSNRKN